MGFADFRAAFTPETGKEWTVEPEEGSLMQREDTNFIVRFRPQGPGVSEGYLVVETEDFKTPKGSSPKMFQPISRELHLLSRSLTQKDTKNVCSLKSNKQRKRNTKQ